ncbi:ABC transporter permease [Actinomadura scrupuli]|uniref:ABC transporter permease n=1 Tax=Actinomadura scrupuli TaxID=559629 RepID=UPI003D9561BC
MSTAIHDIGYRHYDGPRLGRAYVLRSLFVHNLRAAYGLGRPAKAKVMPFLLCAFMLVPAAGSIAVVALTKRPDLLISYSKYAVFLQVLIAIFLASQAPVLAARELRSHVVPLYFSRPVGRLDFVVAKYTALTTALFLLMAAPVTLLYVGALVTRDQKPDPAAPGGPVDGGGQQGPSIGEHTLHFLGGLTGCVVFALVLAGIGLVVAAFTPRRGFGVAAVMAVYMVTSATVLIVQGIAEATGNYGLAGWMGLFTPFNLVDIVQVKLLGAERAAPFVPSSWLGGPVAALICVALIAGSITILSARFQKAGTS